MNAKTKKIFKISVDVLLWAFLIFSLVMTVLAFSAQASGQGVPKLGGKYYFTVQTDSMVGPDGFNPGDMIIGEDIPGTEKSNLQVGDVITFYFDRTPDDGVDNKELNSHRIIEVKRTSAGFVSYVTKGDNYAVRDSYEVPAGDVIAKWTGKKIPGIGKAIDFLQSKTGFLVCVVIPMALFFAYELYVFIKTLMEVKNKGKKVITAGDEELIKQRAIEEYLAKQAAAKAAEEENAAKAASAENAPDEKSGQ